MRNRLGTMLKVHPWVQQANESMKRQRAGIVHRREAPDKAERRRSALDWRRQGPRHRQSSGAQLAEGRGVRAGDMDFEKSDHESVLGHTNHSANGIVVRLSFGCRKALFTPRAKCTTITHKWAENGINRGAVVRDAVGTKAPRASIRWRSLLNSAARRRRH